MHSGTKKLLANNTYIFNPNPTKKKETSACYLDFSNNINYGMSTITNNADKPITLQESYALYEFQFFVMVQEDAQIDMEWKPQLLLSNTLLPYQPYQESQATLPYELNAIPVSSGGNVTIDGQQYIADYVDIEKGVLVRNVKKGFLKSFQWLKAIDKGVVRFYASMFDTLGINNNKIVIDAPAISSHFILVTSTPDRTGTFILNADGTNANIGFAFSTDTTISSDEFNNWILKNKPFVFIQVLKEEIPLTSEQIQAFKALVTYYPKTYVTTESEQLNAYTMFNYPVSMEKGWEYVKQQIGDTRKYVYDMDTKLTETEASTLEAKIDTAILSEMVGG